MRAGGAAAAGLRQLPAGHKRDEEEVLGRAAVRWSPSATVKYKNKAHSSR